jgi:hypothetical protein
MNVRREKSERGGRKERMWWEKRANVVKRETREHSYPEEVRGEVQLGLM